MFLLDSDIIIWIIRNDKRVVSAINKLTTRGVTGISTITIAEVYKNAFPEELKRTEELFAKQVIIDVSGVIAREAGKYWHSFHSKLTGLSLSDCLVAATAKDQEAQLLTLNTKHFPMEDIKVLDPTKINNRLNDMIVQ